MGQCTEALKEKLQSLATFNDTDKKIDTIDIIELIKSVAFKLEAHEDIHVATFVLKTQIVNSRQHNMSIIDYIKLLQANELANKQMKGVIWEYTITTLATLREIRSDETLDDAKNAQMFSAKGNSKNRQMAVAFLLGGSKYYNSLRIKL